MFMLACAAFCRLTCTWARAAGVVCCHDGFASSQLDSCALSSNTPLATQFCAQHTVKDANLLGSSKRRFKESGFCTLSSKASTNKEFADAQRLEDSSRVFTFFCEAWPHWKSFHWAWSTGLQRSQGTVLANVPMTKTLDWFWIKLILGILVSMEMCDMAWTEQWASRAMAELSELRSESRSGIWWEIGRCCPNWVLSKFEDGVPLAHDLIEGLFHLGVGVIWDQIWMARQHDCSRNQRNV
jgi:hypothetical protein